MVFFTSWSKAPVQFFFIKNLLHCLDENSLRTLAAAPRPRGYNPVEQPQVRNVEDTEVLNSCRILRLFESDTVIIVGVLRFCIEITLCVAEI